MYNSIQCVYISHMSMTLLLYKYSKTKAITVRSVDDTRTI